MRATITYHIQEMRHPWDKDKGMIMCLCKKVQPDDREHDPWSASFEPVAIFNLDSEARNFEAYLKGLEK